MMNENVKTKLTQLLPRIATLIPTLDGWCSPERACEYAAMIVGLRVDLSVCLGVWAGRDVLAMGLAHQAIGHGRVLAIDAWAASASVVGQTGANAEWWADQDKHDLIYDRFLAAVRDLELGGHVEIHRARTADVPLVSNIGLLIVDGNHGPEAFDDVLRWAPRVRPGGVVFCDDLQWEGGEVAKAVEWLKENGFEKLYDRDSGVFLQRVTR